MEKQIDEVITDKNFKSNKIEPISNMDIDVMNTGLPLELAGEIAIDLYEKGYRKETRGEWVSVEDKLPQENVRVLVWLKTKYNDYLMDTDRRNNGDWVRWGTDIKYWQPLPQPPKMRGE